MRLNKIPVMEVVNIGKNVKIGNRVVQYGRTLVRELLNAGYSISGFEQIIEEPTLATCNLLEGGKTIAVLSFYNLKEKISIDELGDVPIDLVLLHSKNKSKILSKSQALKNRIIFTCLIHLFAAAIFFCVYAVPALFTWVQNTEIRANGGRMPVAMALLVLPAILVTFIWGGVDMKQNRIAKIILLLLWLVLNVAISLAYLVLIYNAFTRRFF